MHFLFKYFSGKQVMQLAYPTALFFMLFFSSNVFSQYIGYKQYGVSDGLPQSEVVSIFEDSKGFIWVGTKYGIGRLNGQAIHSFSNENGILASSVEPIGELSNGDVLTITQYGYVVYAYNNNVKSFKFPFFKSGARSFSWFDNNNRAYTLFFNKYLFLVFELTPNGLVNSTSKFEYARPYINDDYNSVILYSRSSDGFYLGSTEKLIFVDKKHVVSLPFKNSHTIFEAQDRNVYMIYGNEKKISNSQSLAENEFYSHLQPGSLLRLTKGSFEVVATNQALLNSQMAKVGVSKSNQIVICNLEKNEMIYLSSKKDRTFKIPSNSFNKLYFDQNDNLWGASSQGLFKFFPSFFVNFSEKEGVNPDIQSIVSDKNGVIWLSSFYKGIQYIDNLKVEKLCENPSYNGISYVFYPGSNMDYKGDIYFTSTNTSTIALRKGVLDKSDKLFTNHSSLYFYDDTLRKCYYIATTAGIIKKAYNSDREEVIPINPGPKPSNHAVSIVRHSYDKLFIGGFKALLVYSDSAIEKIPNANHPDLPGANTMVKDYKGNIWIGNIDGIYLYRNGKFAKVKNDFFNSLVLSLSVVDSTKLFIGGIGKIGFIDLKSFYDENKLLIRCFDKQNGFIGGECQQNAVTQDPNGDLWVGCSNGVVRIDPKAFDCMPQKTGIILTGIYCYREELFWDTISSNQFLKNTPYLDHDDNNLRFEYTATNSFLPENSLFTYKLEGFDKVWSLPTHERYATYTNLPPGKYQFFVKVVGNALNSDKAIAYTEFYVRHAFWQKWYFLLFTGLFFLSLLVIGISHYYTRRNRIAKANLEKERQFSQLQYKALRNQFEPHFIFNAFNTIGASIYSDDKQISYDYLQQFSKLIRTTLASADKLFRSLHDELEFVSAYLDLEKRRFGDKLVYEIQIGPDVDTSFQIPKLLIQTFVVHAINSGLVQRLEKGRIQIIIESSISNLLIVICDNRIDSKETNLKTLKSKDNGLEIILNYVQLLNQSTELKIEFDLSELTKENNSKKGRCVKIKVPKELT